MKKQGKRIKKQKTGAGKLFFRAMGFTLVALLCPAAVFMGSAKAYEAIRENGFAEKVSAVEVLVGDETVTVHFFDSEFSFNKWIGEGYVKQAVSSILFTAQDVYEVFFAPEGS